MSDPDASDSELACNLEQWAQKLSQLGRARGVGFPDLRGGSHWRQRLKQTGENPIFPFYYRENFRFSVENERIK